MIRRNFFFVVFGFVDVVVSCGIIICEFVVFVFEDEFLELQKFTLEIFFVGFDDDVVVDFVDAFFVDVEFRGFVSNRNGAIFAVHIEIINNNIN